MIAAIMNIPRTAAAVGNGKAVIVGPFV